MSIPSVTNTTQTQNSYPHTQLSNSKSKFTVNQAASASANPGAPVSGPNLPLEPVVPPVTSIPLHPTPGPRTTTAH